ncbi:hypothetical protein DFQ01_14015 [Paenibacillus cellulosilyticus]|uniref:ABC-2 type transport system permease protein n=1 Tax=Paenibacillus cellulosilyticus TaxID=375489 RepID=A0A2V2YNG1_9BACL|nr:hypothetical protein [Paenibacillus cellulosilyticus]PWV90633.1 hypothetical protein DFQ01_14015 [Paenibacillus cellulosilyticus]QKS43944.1 hypothetical protein HUB94_05505 [Paenibacillus cellulosilyticus]
MSRRQRPFSPIVEFEHSAFTPYLPTTKKTASYWVLGIIIAIFACRIGFGDRYEPEAVYVLGVSLAWVSFIAPMSIRALQQPSQPFQEWWLTFPLDRRTLVRAKLLASLRLNAHIAAAIWLIVTVHNFSAAVLTESPFHASLGRLWADAASYGLLFAAIVLLITCLATLAPIALHGWYRLLIFPYLVLWGFPMGNLGSLLQGEVQTDRWLQTPMVLLYACAGALLGWILYHVAIVGVAKVAMKGLASHEPGKALVHLHRPASAAQRTVRGRPTAAGFRSLFQLERSRHRSIAANKWLQLVRGILVLAIMVGGYFSLSNSEWIDMIRAILVIPSIFIITHMTLTYANDMGKRRLEWMLGFPYSRLKLAFSRLLAIWATTALWLGGALLAAAVGAGIRYIVNRPDSIGTSNSLYTAAYVLLLFTVYIIFGTLVSHVQYSTAKYPVLSAIGLPFMMLSYVAPMLFNQYVLPESLPTAGVSHSLWIGLGLFAVIGLPFALVLFVISTRGMAFSMLASQAKLARRSGVTK